MAHELPIPAAAMKDAQSLEMIRVWLAQGKQHCVLNIGFWEGRGLDELEGWGVLLADMLHHIADAHKAEYGRDPTETIAVVRKVLDVELNHPSSSRRGEFVARKKSAKRKSGPK